MWYVPESTQMLFYGLSTLCWIVGSIIGAAYLYFLAIEKLWHLRVKVERYFVAPIFVAGVFSFSVFFKLAINTMNDFSTLSSMLKLVSPDLFMTIFWLLLAAVLAYYGKDAYAKEMHPEWEEKSKTTSKPE